MIPDLRRAGNITDNVRIAKHLTESYNDVDSDIR